MAAKYRKIDPRIWRDERFRMLGPEEKLVALYCLTAQVNRCGLFLFSPAMASEELCLKMETLRGRFSKAVSTLRWRWDKEQRVLYFPTWWKYNPPENPNVLKGCLTDLEDLPETPLLKEFFANETYLNEELRATFRERYPKPSPNQEQEQEQKQEQDSTCTEPPKAAASVPTVLRAPVLVFPTVGGKRRGETDWPLTEEKLAEYVESFPGVDVLTELRKAKQWCIDNPAKRKTWSGVAKFLSGWLGRVQNEGGNRGSSSGKSGGRGSGSGVRPGSRIESPPGKYDAVPVIVAGSEAPNQTGAQAANPAREAA